MEFGFSIIGAVYLLMLFIPNIIWSKNKPRNYDRYVHNENKTLLALERIGEAAVTVCALIFRDRALGFDFQTLCLAMSVIFMILYEIYWLRYFKSDMKMSDFYSDICGIPVAGATCPVAAFFLLGVYKANVFTVISAVILGVGHIGIHLNRKKEQQYDSIENNEKDD